MIQTTPTAVQHNSVPMRPLPPDLKAHLKVVAIATKNEIKVLSIKLGNGPPRAYPDGRSDVVVLMIGEDRKVLRRVALPDPLELRITDKVKKEQRPRPAVRNQHSDSLATSQPAREVTSRESVTHAPTAQLQLFLPFIDGAKTIEFHRKEDTGPLLGSASLANIR